MKRRNFVGLTIASAGAGVLFAFGQSSSIKKYQQIELGDLENKTKDAKAITTEERKLRIKKAQQLLQKNEIHALIIEPSTNLNYFTGLKWWPSERTMVAIIPAVGEVSYVCPAFEEDRFRELIQIGKEVFIWQEDESPSKQIAKALKKYGYSNGKIAIEENTRFFIADDLKKAAPDYHYICGPSNGSFAGRGSLTPTQAPGAEPRVTGVIQPKPREPEKAAVPAVAAPSVKLQSAPALANPPKE